MKHVKAPLWSMAFLCLFIFSSCSKSSSDSTGNTTSPNVNPGNTIVSGTWKIGSYTQRTEDKTAQFEGYSFTFSTGGLLTAVKAGNATSVTWSYQPSIVGYYGNTATNASFTINLGTASPLSRLTRTWNVDTTKITSSSIRLINPEVQDDEQITFSKQ